MQTSHYNHLLAEGFTSAQVGQLRLWGVRSITFRQAQAQNIYANVKNPDKFAGLWFPFAKDFGQLRADYGDVKYRSPLGANVQPWYPNGSMPSVITEGFKDAAIATFAGIPTGAIAGVSHYKCLPQGKGQTIVFDSDAHTNPHVIAALVKAAQWTGGKIAMVPIEYGAKAGLTEFLKCQQNPYGRYVHLLDQALNCKDFLWTIASHWSELSSDKRLILIKSVIRLYQECYPDSIKSYLQHLENFAPGVDLTALVPITVFQPARCSIARAPLIGNVPIKIGLCKANQDLLATGTDVNREPLAFRLVVDALGVAECLRDLGVGYEQSPQALLTEFGNKSGMKISQINSVWRGASKSPRRPSVPVDKIRDRVVYHLRQSA